MRDILEDGNVYIHLGCVLKCYSARHIKCRKLRSLLNTELEIVWKDTVAAQSDACLGILLKKMMTATIVSVVLMGLGATI
jgi:hypothetical protein